MMQMIYSLKRVGSVYHNLLSVWSELYILK
jgi:predicted 2-oxoglutarate/Fe(II)-dependent dioxygenase YbiX